MSNQPLIVVEDLAKTFVLHNAEAATIPVFERLRLAVGPGECVVLAGSSGVGKSTLINRMLGSARMEVGTTREDDKGRHTTTHRELFVLPQGGLVIDTPGMRELALWADADGDGPPAGFEDIAEVAEGCRFRDCRHAGEPGCAVMAAVSAGELSAERLEHAHKLERELLQQRARVDLRLRTAQHQARKAIARAARVRMKEKGRG